MDEGLIPVESEESDSTLGQVKLSQRDCTIGPGSTFYLYKGFCQGAKEVLRGDIGVKKMKKPASISPFEAFRTSQCADIKSRVSQLQQPWLDAQAACSNLISLRLKLM
jgi:hypothetical protein